MISSLFRPQIGAAIVAVFGIAGALPASAADQTTTGAMASIGYLAGTWHCTGGGPDEDDTYTFDKNWWHDTDSNGNVTSGTFDAKRQKWIVFIMGADGRYAVNEGTQSTPNDLVLTIPYPPGKSETYTFTRISDTQFVLGKQSCTKK